MTSSGPPVAVRRAHEPRIAPYHYIWRASDASGLRRAATGGANTRSQPRLSHDDLPEIALQLGVNRASPAGAHKSVLHLHDTMCLCGRPVGLQENVSSFFLRAPNHPTSC